LALLPAAQLFGNWSASDASGRYFTRDYAVNALEALPPNAIYFTAGDNDTFPVLYVQAVEGVRRDVRIINLSLANTSWYVDRIAREDRRFPLRLSRGEREAAANAGWRDTSVVVPVRATAAQLDLPPDSPVPEAVTLRPKPFFGTQTLPSDVVLLDIVSTNAWRDPITFAITAAPNRPAWLGAHARLDGLFWRLVPVADLPPDTNRLRANLLDRYAYRGYNDPSIRIDDVSRIIALQYYAALRELLSAEFRRGAVDRCREARARMFSLLPPDRLTIPSSTQRELNAGCG
jgi:hypothetical protein